MDTMTKNLVKAHRRFLAQEVESRTKRNRERKLGKLQKNFIQGYRERYPEDNTPDTELEKVFETIIRRC